MTDGVKAIAREYLRTVDEAAATKEDLLAGWAADYYRPGYLADDEWERLKDLLDAGDHEHALMQLEIACYRKAATELECEDEFDDDWPAKGDGV